MGSNPTGDAADKLGMRHVQPKLGDFGLVRTPDLGGRIIRLGTDSWMNHAFIYVGNGHVIEARPGGAGFANVDSYTHPQFHLAWSTDLIEIDDYTRDKIVKWAVAQQGVGYNWLDIAALSLHCIGLGTPAWARKKIEDDDRLICSQLVDKAYRLAGVKLFDDGRLPGSVTPGDLWNRLLGLGW